MAQTENLPHKTRAVYYAGELQKLQLHALKIEMPFHDQFQPSAPMYTGGRLYRLMHVAV